MVNGCHLSPFFSFGYFAGKKCTKKSFPCRLGGGSFAYGIADGKSIWFFCLHLGQLKHLADVDWVLLCHRCLAKQCILYFCGEKGIAVCLALLCHTLQLFS